MLLQSVISVNGLQAFSADNCVSRHETQAVLICDLSTNYLWPHTRPITREKCLSYPFKAKAFSVDLQH